MNSGGTRCILRPARYSASDRSSSRMYSITASLQPSMEHRPAPVLPPRRPCRAAARKQSQKLTLSSSLCVQSGNDQVLVDARILHVAKVPQAPEPSNCYENYASPELPAAFPSHAHFTLCLGPYARREWVVYSKHSLRGGWP